MDNIITPWETEQICKQIQPYALEFVGSDKWLQQHEYLEKLNLQAHHSGSKIENCLWDNNYTHSLDENRRVRCREFDLGW